MQATNPMHDRKRCGAKTRLGTPCRNFPMANGRCRMHGGKTPKGLASPHTKTGRYSKYLPRGLVTAYSKALQDERLLELRDEIALLDARLAQLLGSVETGESTAAWKQAQTALTALETAFGAAEKAACRAVLDRLHVVFSGGQGDYAAWAEIERVI